MTVRQKVWFFSILILLICILAALVIYKYTGNLILVLFIAPPVIHWIIKKRYTDEI